MKNLLLSLVALLTLTGVAQAQFKITVYNKTAKNTSRPDIQYLYEGGAGSSCSTNYYFRWEKDFVRIQSVDESTGTYAVTENLFYYADFDPETATLLPLSEDQAWNIGRFECMLKSRNDATIPTYRLGRTAFSASRKYYAQSMESQLPLSRLTKEGGEAFLKKLATMSLAFGTKKPARIVLKPRKMGSP
jgi:hypothetical protein